MTSKSPSFQEDQDQPMFPKLDGKSGPALPIDEERSKALIQSAIFAGFAGLNTGLDTQAPHPFAARNKMPKWHKFAYALAAVLVVGLAFGALYTTTHKPNPSKEPAKQIPNEIKPIQTAEPSVIAPVFQPSSASAQPEASASQAPPQAAKPLNAEDLMQQANRLRSSKQWQDAERTYQLVTTRFPGSPSSYTAMVASASLLLEHLGSPQEALRRYQAAIQAMPSGSLTEEAHWGITLCHHNLHTKEAERKSLEEFIKQHPQSLHAVSAKQRLAALQSLTP